MPKLALARELLPVALTAGVDPEVPRPGRAPRGGGPAGAGTQAPPLRPAAASSSSATTSSPKCRTARAQGGVASLPVFCSAAPQFTPKSCPMIPSFKSTIRKIAAVVNCPRMSPRKKLRTRL